MKFFFFFLFFFFPLSLCLPFFFFFFPFLYFYSFNFFILFYVFVIFFVQFCLSFSYFCIFPPFFFFLFSSYHFSPPIAVPIKTTDPFSFRFLSLPIFFVRKSEKEGMRRLFRRLFFSKTRKKKADSRRSKTAEDEPSLSTLLFSRRKRSLPSFSREKR